MLEHHNDTLRVRLDYQDINWLFVTPSTSPFSEDYQIYSGMPGIEFIVNEMRANQRLKRVETTIVLPPEKITPSLEYQTGLAVRRYCQARGHALQQDQRILRTRILRSVTLAVVGVLISVVLGNTLASEEDFVLSLIGNVLYFFGWVAVWYPMDAIVFGRRDLAMDVTSYKRVEAMALSVVVSG